MNNALKFQQLLEHDDAVNVREYSGRFMYGKKCLAITGQFNDCTQAIGSALQLALDLHIEDINHGDSDLEDVQDPMCNLISLAMEFQMDNMGLDIVLYWPRVAYTHTDNDNDEEDK